MRLTERAKREYRYEDNNGMYRRSNLLDRTRGRFDYEIKTPSGKILNGPWMIKEGEFLSLLDEGRVYWATGEDETPYGKIYLNESEGQISNDWLGIEFGTNQEAGLDFQELFEGLKIFDFPKPISLIKHFATIGLGKDDIIMDFFSGSATTAHAVIQLNAEDGGNRKFILTQLPEIIKEDSEAFKAGYKNIAQVGEERIRRAGKKILEENKDKEGFDADKFDKGFKVYKLSQSNFDLWDNANEGDLQKKLELHVDNIKSGSTEEDILNELLLKAGYSLTEKIEEIIIDGKKIFSVASGEVIVCLEKDLDRGVMKKIADKKPKLVICLNSGFKKDEDLTNAAKIMENDQIEFRIA
jgi:adenine-specific DNA-methyltransferase